MSQFKTSEIPDEPVLPRDYRGRRGGPPPIPRVRWQEQTFGGMLSIGTNPTVDGTHRTVEVNLFDFDREIYGEKLTLEFVAWLRGQEKYDSLDALVAQIGQDKVDSLRALG